MHSWCMMRFGVLNNDERSNRLCCKLVAPQKYMSMNKSIKHLISYKIVWSVFHIEFVHAPPPKSHNTTHKTGIPTTYPNHGRRRYPPTTTFQRHHGRDIMSIETYTSLVYTVTPARSFLRWLSVGFHPTQHTLEFGRQRHYHHDNHVFARY